MSECSNSYLRNLSPEQHSAVTSNATALNVLAGPGSGKTRVLTCRVAHKVIHDGTAPDAICVLTFTRKAATEMRKRLLGLLGREIQGQLSIGTFHSICAAYLGKHGSKVGLRDNFKIINRSQSCSILKKLTKDMELEVKPDVDYWLDEISRAKGQGISSENYRVMHGKHSSKRHIADVFTLYQNSLVESSTVDYDDLILLAIRLLQEHPSVVTSIQHVLVDEFQDTSQLQFELLKLLCVAKKCITVVGDPDQSIYGWRAADATILTKLRRHFSTLVSIKLEHNFRSTGSIVNCAMKLLAQDKNRIAKKLTTSNMKGHPVYINSVPNSTDEANFIVKEITRLCSQSSGFYNWNDFAVLVRTNSLTRPIEEALNRASIPYKVFAGSRFFDRIEIRDVLAYLQFANSGGKDKLSFSRIINVPKRGAGAVQVQRLLKHAADTNVSLLDAVRETVRNSAKAKINAKLRPFLDLIDKLILEIEQKTNIEDLIRIVVTKTNYEDHLKTSHRSDWEGRWDNIKELVNYAAKFKQRDVVDAESSSEVSSITRFLAVTATTSEAADDHSPSIEGVTLTTLHSAKGLEWPCVFIPAVEDEIIPHIRSKGDPAVLEEERRLLYVGMTRAQCFLYCTYTDNRSSLASTYSPKRSRFLDILTPDSLTKELPLITNKTQKDVALLLERDPKPVDASKFQEQPPSKNSVPMQGFQSASVVYAAMQTRALLTAKSVNVTIESKAKPSGLQKTNPRKQLTSTAERVIGNENRQHQESDTTAKRRKTDLIPTRTGSTTLGQTSKRNSTKKANPVRANTDIRSFFSTTNSSVRKS